MPVVPTTSTLTLSEFETFGANNAQRSEATFRIFLASMTTDPDAVAAAEHGRRQALDNVGGVHIVVSAERTTIARVRDDAGIHDVTRGKASGWQCTCSDAGPCVHIRAAAQSTEATGL